MKKAVLQSFILILFLMSVYINAEEYTIYKGSYLATNLFGTENCNLEIRFDDEKNIFYYFYQLPLTNTPTWIFLSENDLAILRNNLAKFIEWEEIAQREKASITRELPESEIPTSGVVQGTGYGRRECAAGLLILRFVFTTNTRINSPLLLISSNQVYTRSLNNDIASMQIANQLTKEQAQTLLGGIQPENITSTLDRIRRQNNLFN